MGQGHALWSFGLLVFTSDQALNAMIFLPIHFPAFLCVPLVGKFDGRKIFRVQTWLVNNSRVANLGLSRYLVARVGILSGFERSQFPTVENVRQGKPAGFGLVACRSGLRYHFYLV